MTGVEPGDGRYALAREITYPSGSDLGEPLPEECTNALWQNKDSLGFKGFLSSILNGWEQQGYDYSYLWELSKQKYQEISVSGISFFEVNDIENEHTFIGLVFEYATKRMPELATRLELEFSLMYADELARRDEESALLLASVAIHRFEQGRLELAA